MKTASALLPVITGLLCRPVAGAPADLPHSARDVSLELEYDCDMAAEGLTAGCDLAGGYFTCTNNVVTIFSCTGGCQVVGSGNEARCDGAVYVSQAAYVAHNY